MIVKIEVKKVTNGKSCGNSTDSPKTKNTVKGHSYFYFECNCPRIEEHSFNSSAEFNAFLKNTYDDVHVIIIGEVSDKIGPSHVIEIYIQELKKLVYVTDAWLYLMNNNGKTIDTFSC